jgi:hypothetical protein
MSRDLADLYAVAVRRTGVDDIEVSRFNQMDLVANGRILPDAAIETATNGLAEQCDCHPPIAVEVRRVRHLKGHRQRISLRRRGVRPDLRTDSVKLGVSQRDA